MQLSTEVINTQHLAENENHRKLIEQMDIFHLSSFLTRSSGPGSRREQEDKHQSTLNACTEEDLPHI